MSATISASRAFGAVARAVPAIAVFLTLGAVAYWGHHTGWRLPKFSDLVGGASHGDDWCDEHGVPESICIECQPELSPPATAYDYCKAHGVPVCLWEHPEAAETKTPPQVSTEQRAEAEAALKLTPRGENNPLCTLHERRLQFASAEAAEKAGIDIAVVDVGPIVESVPANGEIIYDPTRQAKMSSRVPGMVARVFKNVGERVTRGELIALVDSAEVGKAKAELLQAVAHHRLVDTTLERLRPLAKTGEVPERTFREAVTADDEAHIRILGTRQALVNLGFDLDADDWENMPTDQAAAKLKHLGLPTHIAAEVGPTSNLFPIRAPLDGYVSQCFVVDGEPIAVSDPMYTVTDISRMWMMVDVRQDDAARIAPNMTVRFHPSWDQKQTIAGRIAWISTEADHRTRTVKVRVELPNDDGRLRSNTFGSAEIVLRESPQSIVVPTEAVHWEGCCHVVFVRDRNWFTADAPKFFHVRKVRLGVRDGARTEILAGLLPGEVIAAKGSAVLEAQLLKSKLGEADEAVGH